jgi:hypothetical protein
MEELQSLTTLNTLVCPPNHHVGLRTNMGQSNSPDRMEFMFLLQFSGMALLLTRFPAAGERRSGMTSSPLKSQSEETERTQNSLNKCIMNNIQIHILHEALRAFE